MAPERGAADRPCQGEHENRRPAGRAGGGTSLVTSSLGHMQSALAHRRSPLATTHHAPAARLRTRVAGSDSWDTWCYVEGSDEPSAVRLSLTGWDGAGAGGAPCRAGSRWHRSCPVSRVAQGVALAGSGWTETWLRVRTTRPRGLLLTMPVSHRGDRMTTVTDIRPVKIDTSEEAVADMRSASRGPASPPLSWSPTGRRACSWRHSGARPVLGVRLRLARVRGEAERAAAVQDRDRRGGRPLHPREVAPRERDAVDHDARLAGIGHRAARRVDPLTDPPAHGGSAADAFDLVLPSLPGYGYSSQPTEIGWDAGRIASAWTELMHRLGYTAGWPRAATSAPASPTRWAARRPTACSAFT